MFLKMVIAIMQNGKKVTRMDDLISRKAVELAMIEKGQNSKRYRLGETWELNGEEIREALATIPSVEPEQIVLDVDIRANGWNAKSAIRFCPTCGRRIRKPGEPL